MTEDFSVIRDAAKEEDFTELKSLVAKVNKGKGLRSEVLRAIDRAAENATPLPQEELSPCHDHEAYELNDPPTAVSHI